MIDNVYIICEYIIMTDLQNKKIKQYSFQTDLDRIEKDYARNINNVRSFIEVKRLERIRAKDLENIKQAEEILQSLKKK